MKESYWGYWLVLLGVFVVIIMMLIQNVTSNNTEDSYAIKQISEAAMVAAVDYAYYREYGEVKINKEKFIEVFTIMFANQASLTTNYKLKFTAIYEAPPKVSIEIKSKTKPIVINTEATDFDIVNRVDQILEQNS